MNIPKNYTGFVYLWYDHKHNLFCIGSHMGTIKDGYVTSTGHMGKAYKKRPVDFKRRIIYWHFDDHKSLYEKETEVLSKIKDHELYTNDNRNAGTIRYYNMKKMGRGLDSETARRHKLEFWQSEAGQKRKTELSNQMKGNTHGAGKEAWNKGKPAPQISKALKKSNAVKLSWTNERRQKATDRLNKTWNSGAMDNRQIHSEESNKKRSETQKGKSKNVSLEGRKKISITKAKTYNITFPDGHEETITNLSQFARSYNLNVKNLQNVSRGMIYEHKGYKCRRLP